MADGTEAYKGSDTYCELNGLVPGGSYWVRAWSWVDGSDVWSEGYAQLSVVLPVPAPEALKAQAISGTEINLWWLVPDEMVSVPTVSTIIQVCVGDYPTDPPDPADTEVYDVITGDAGVKNYIWTSASPGTPYFFALWFYNSASDNYTDPEYAVATTPAGFGSDIFPTGSGYFEPPSHTAMADNPFDPVVGTGASIWEFEHGIMWGFLVMVGVILVGTWLAVETKSGLITTFGMVACMVVAGIEGVCPFWLCVPMGLLGLFVSWIGTRQYA